VVSRQHPRSTRLLVVVLVSISLAVITLDYREGEDGPLAGLGRIALATMAPLQEAVTTATRPIGDFFSGLVHLPSVQKENERLRRENQELTAAIAAAADKESQIEQLSNLLGLQESLTPDSVPAVVIANGLSNFRYTITINKGSVDGVERDQPVVAGSEQAPILVGRVVAVSAISAEVELIIDRNSVVAGRLSVSHETGQIQGQGDQDLRMTLVTPGTSVTGDETVVTQGYEVSGQQGLYPPGLVIGEVSRVIQDADGLQEFVTVRPAIDFSTLEFVLVLQTSRSEG
jgi:rod shape-determining protein MreC